jgi:hypothetical protein
MVGKVIERDYLKLLYLTEEMERGLLTYHYKNNEYRINVLRIQDLRFP